MNTMARSAAGAAAAMIGGIFALVIELAVPHDEAGGTFPDRPGTSIELAA
jgi:hypothetical protein